MPALINIWANLGLGAAVALVGRRSPSLREEVLTWYLLLLLGFESLCITPVATFLFRFYPQWSTLYWFDPQLFPHLDEWLGWLSGLAVLLNYLAALGGYGLARWGIIRAQRLTQAAPAVIAAAGIIAVVLIFGDRVVLVGDYEAYLDGRAKLLLASPAGWLGLGLYLGAGLFVYWIRARFSERTLEA